MNKLDFKTILQSIKLIEGIVKHQLTIEGLRYEEDITDREVRSLNMAKGFLVNGTSGMYDNDASEYWLEKGLEILKELGHTLN